MHSSFAAAFFISIIVISNTHAVRQIDGTAEEIINAYVNQAKTVTIPFQKCFKA
jgi:acid phosphatase family membrane protein YuiD